MRKLSSVLCAVVLAATPIGADFVRAANSPSVGKSGSAKTTTPAKPASSAAVPKKSPSTQLPHARVFVKRGDGYVVRIRYPKTGVKELDTAIYARIHDSVSEFVDRVVIGRGMDEKSKNTVLMVVDYTRTNHRGLVNITVSLFQYVGGPHGETDHVNFGVDLRTGKILKDSDVFKDPRAARQKLAAIIFEKLKKQSPKKLYDDLEKVRVSLADVGGLKVLRFTPDGLEFRSEQYQVGPYSAGTATAVVPYSEIMDLFVPVMAKRLQ